MKKIQVVVTEETFKELSKKLLDEGISKQQFLENQIEQLEQELSAPQNACNSAKLNELTGQYQSAKLKMDQLFEEWELVSLEE